MIEKVEHSGDFIMIRSWQVKLCSPLGPSKSCGAALLSRFEFWHKGNVITAEKTGKKEYKYVTLSIPQIKRFLFDQWSVNTIQKSIDFLVSEGLLQKVDNGGGRKCSYKLMFQRLNEFANHIKNDTVLPYANKQNHIKNDTPRIKFDMPHIKNDTPTISNLTSNHIKNDTPTISNLIDSKEYKERRILKEDIKEDYSEGTHGSENSISNSKVNSNSKFKLIHKPELKPPETTKEISAAIFQAGLVDDIPENRLAAWKIIEPFLETEIFKNIWSMSSDRYPDADPVEVVQDWVMSNVNWMHVKQFKINKIGGWARVNHESKNKNYGTSSRKGAAGRKGSSTYENGKSKTFPEPDDRFMDADLMAQDIAKYRPKVT